MPDKFNSSPLIYLTEYPVLLVSIVKPPEEIFLGFLGYRPVCLFFFFEEIITSSNSFLAAFIDIFKVVVISSIRTSIAFIFICVN